MSPKKVSEVKTVVRKSTSKTSKSSVVDWGKFEQLFDERASEFFSKHPTEKQCIFVPSEIYEITNECARIPKSQYWTETHKKVPESERIDAVKRFINQGIDLCTNSVNLNNHIRKLCGTKEKFTLHKISHVNHIIVKK